GRDVIPLSVAERRAAGLAHIPEDRHRRGLVLAMSTRENLILGHHRRPAFSHGLLHDERAVDRFAAERCREYDVRVPSLGTPALADRIAVLYNGRIAREFRRGEADAPTLGLYMTGGGPPTGQAAP